MTPALTIYRRRCNLETQKTIRDWAVSAFGKQAHPRTIAVRTLEEMAELLKALDEYDHGDPRVHEEMADVAICLYYLAESTGCMLKEQIERKMKTNRSREWVTDGRGNGYHKK